MNTNVERTIGFGLAVIRPRAHAGRSREMGAVDAERIVRFENEDYVATVSEMNVAVLVVELQTLMHDYAKIDRTKYCWLRSTIYMSAAGIRAFIRH